MSEINDLTTMTGLSKNELATIASNLTLIKGIYVGGVPAAAVASVGANTTAITNTTAVTIVANTAASNLYISAVEAYNASTNAAVLSLLDSTPTVFWTGVVPASSSLLRTFSPPIKLASAKGLQGKLADTNGSVTVSSNGWIG